MTTISPSFSNNSNHLLIDFNIKSEIDQSRISSAEIIPFPEYQVQQVSKESAWQRFKDIFTNPSPLHRSIRALAWDHQVSENFTDSYKKTIVDTFNSSEFGYLRSYLSTVLNKLNPKQLNETVKYLFELSIENPNNAQFDPTKLKNKLMSFLSLQKLEAVAQAQFSHFTTAKKSAEDMATIVEGPLGTEQEEIKQTIKQTLSLYLISVLEKTLNFIITIFNVKDIFSEPEFEYEAHYKIRILGEWWTAIAGFVTTLSILFGNNTLAALVGGVGSLVVATSLVIYAKWFRPLPEKLPASVNYTKEAILGNFEPVLARDSYIDTIIHVLESNIKGTRTHPLILGKSGVGKTEIVKGLTQRIIAGNVPDILKNKKVFHINTADLLAGVKKKESAITEILEQIRGHEKDVIIFFDEIHLAWKTEETAILGEKLKTLLDPGPNSLPYCIAATTIEEYKEYISGKWAFERRFELVPIEETNEDQTTLILNNLLYREAPNIHVSMETLKELCRLCKIHFPKHSHPAKPKSILAKAISQVRASRNFQTASIIQCLKDNRMSLACSYMKNKGSDLLLDSESGRKLKEEIQHLDQQIRQQEQEMREELQKWTQLNVLQDRYNVLRSDLFKSSIAIKKAIEANKPLDSLLKKHLLDVVYLNPILQASVAKKQREITTRQSEITKELIEQVILKEKENIQIERNVVAVATTNLTDSA